MTSPQAVRVQPPFHQWPLMTQMRVSILELKELLLFGLRWQPKLAVVSELYP